MSKRLALGPVIALLCVSVALTAFITQTAVRRNYNDMLAGLPDQAARYDILDELDGILRANYYGGSDNAAMLQAIAKGYVSGLPDGYSRYLTAQELERYQGEAIGEMTGVGVKISRTAQNRIRIDDVIDGSPAKQQGIAPGDVIFAVDGIPVNASNYDESAQKLTGDKKSSLDVTVRSADGERTLTLPTGFEALSVVSDHYEDIGYLKLTSFYAGTAAQVKETAEAFAQSGVRGVVLDLRKNKSENVSYAMQTLDVFVPLSEEPAARLVDKKGETVESFMTDAAAVNLPVAVLVSSETLAAAELFCAGLRAFGKGTLVGTGTAGFGLVRRTFKLSNGDAVLLCVGEMLPCRSDSFNGSGLDPDVAVAAEKNTGKLSADSQFLAAVAVLRGESVHSDEEADT